MMKKYIITAKSENDIINLLLNTRSVDLKKVKWNWANISVSEDDAQCSNEREVLDAVEKRDFRTVDEMIMGGDVPVGSMVVVSDGKTPRYGFVCGNGNEWFPIGLKVRESNAIIYSRLNKKGCK